MESRIDHTFIQNKWQNIWTSTNAFDSTLDESCKMYIVLQAPPNITNKLHLGHFINGTLNDVVARRKRQEGYKVCFRAGLDHAGLATQMKVESWLREQGLTKEMLGKEKFLEKCTEWKEKYGGTIISQFKAIGLSCDWNRITFTLDSNYYSQVIDTFVELYKGGLIYKGDYLINWCSALETAISDEECVEVEETIEVYYIKYLLETDCNNKLEYLTVATTRPETMFGDVAVAYNPEDPRYTHLKGRFVQIPLINKSIPLVEDERIKIEFGTGLCKITPAHDKDDYLTAQKYNLEPISIFDKKGHITNTGTRYDTMHKNKARKEVLADLEQLGQLEKIDRKKSMISRCSRSNCVIEPMITPQWFIRMKDLANGAVALLDSGEVEFIPAKVENLFRGWISNIRDWCVSRQIWYGHQIPVWYCEKNHINCKSHQPSMCQTCGSTNLTQETDCLDTWASSYIWQFATFSKEEFEHYYPIDLIVSGQDILFFWIMRMMMTSKFLHNKPPFKRVLFHGIVRDEVGKKMSKSAGNGVDPIDLISDHGLDPIRFGMLMKLPKEGDLKLTQDIIKLGKTFCTKLWNIGRHLQLNNVCVNVVPKLKELQLETTEDDKIINKLIKLIENVNDCHNKLDTHELTSVLYNFTWNEFASGYLEYAKDKLSEERKNILSYVYYNILDMLYPIIPHITSEIKELLYKN
jgi:valyl-tRNA synthetase